MPSASDPRQPNRQGQPEPRPAQPVQRPVRLSLLRVRRSPPRVSLNPLSVQLNSRPPAPRSLLAALALSGRFRRSARKLRLRNRAPMHIMLTARTVWLRRRVPAITPMLAVVPKRRAPQCP